MAIAGDLEHLPIVDVIQLMHSTRNSGILLVRGRKGESQLVFKGGYIVSASHLNNSVRIGQLLIERGLITETNLAKVLSEQKEATGEDRRPLIVMLIDKGLVEEKDAYAALRSLIEMTIIEILTWRRGSFLLEASREAAGAYEYYPQAIEREINVDVQGALMDALRLFDEKMRDGEISMEEDTDGEEEPAEINADLLGLSDMDKLDKKIPGVYRSLPDPGSAFQPAAGTVAVPPVRRLNELIEKLPTMKKTPEVATAVLTFVGSIFERTLTLVVRNSELLAEKGFWDQEPGGRRLTAPFGFHIPLEKTSILQQVVGSGEIYLQSGADPVLTQHLYARIGAPSHPLVLLLPVQRSEQTVFVTYADFGDREPGEVPIEILEMLAEQAGYTITRSS